MQDCYVGDIGDFGKYGLLRWLCQQDEHGDALSLGVLWYRYECCDGGDSIGYLDVPDRPLRECCPDLFDRLREIVQRDRRSIAVIEASGALPPDTVFFSDKMIFANLSVEEARRARLDWSEAGAHAVRVADLVFIDPNTGLAIPTVDQAKRRSDQHVYYDEVKAYWERGQSVVVYQHAYRKSVEAIAADCRKEFKKHGAPEPIVLRWRRGNARLYFILPAPAHEKRISERTKSLLSSEWGRQRRPYPHPHFEPVTAE